MSVLAEMGMTQSGIVRMWKTPRYSVRGGALCQLACHLLQFLVWLEFSLGWR